jgi:hypothetical protein
MTDYRHLAGLDQELAQAAYSCELPIRQYGAGQAALNRHTPEEIDRRAIGIGAVAVVNHLVELGEESKINKFRLGYIVPRLERLEDRLRTKPRFPPIVTTAKLRQMDTVAGYIAQNPTLELSVNELHELSGLRRPAIYAILTKFRDAGTLCAGMGMGPGRDSPIAPTIEFADELALNPNWQVAMLVSKPL